MNKNSTILELVKQKGPILPVQISKEINDNILMTSARLSELLTNKQIKISHIKVGGSPLYYVQGQETRLSDYSDNLVEKEKEAYDLLRQNRILRDAEQAPAIRVALRQIKDYSIPLQVNYQDKKEIFWKWYMMDNNDAYPLIKSALLVEDPAKPEHKTPISQQSELQNTIPIALSCHICSLCLPLRWSLYGWNS